MAYMHVVSLPKLTVLVHETFSYSHKSSCSGQLVLNRGFVINIGGRIVNEAPGKPQAKEITTTHIELSWTKPVTPADEQIIMYAVYFRPSDSPKTSWERMQTNGPEEYIIITDLIKGDLPYVFKVCAVIDNNVGQRKDYLLIVPIL